MVQEAVRAPTEAQQPIHRKQSLQGSFLQAVSRSVRGCRLGDLLLTSHLITQEQLDHALEIQRNTKEQLGAILVREKYVSTVHLYQKLAEQWCIRASAIGVSVMIQATLPTAAHAEETALSQVRLAAAFTPAAVRPQIQEHAPQNLFGTAEIKSNDISAFTKWTSVMKRFEDQMNTQSTSSRVQAWKANIQSLKGKSVREQIAGVNDYLNNTKYIDDSRNYGKSDYWATPAEFLSKGGDCEDYAIAKYASLRALGFSTDQLRIAIVQDKIKKIAHALLIVYTDEGVFVLDNQDKRLRQANDVARYKPVFSINSSNWWLHRPVAGV